MKMWIISVALLFFITKAKAQEGYFWHITDHHFDTTYWSEMRSCNNEVPVRGIYGDYWCDSPWRLVNDSVLSMARIKRDVDFILWTGDNVAHIKDEHINETYNIGILKSITDALKAEFPGVNVYATMGNHDWYPSDQFPDSTHRLYNETADLWEDWIGDPEQVANFRKGAYYTVKTAYGLRIVGLNTNVYYYRNKLTTNIADPVGQFAWMEEVFQNTRAAGERVLLTAHVPPGIHYPGTVMWFYENFNTRFNDILSANADIIVGFFFGHEHSDVIRHLKKADGSPGVAMYMAPSITPWRYKLGEETGDAHNPAIRLVKYNRGSSLPLEIQQYYMDLTESNKHNASNWTLAYTSSQAYGMPDLSAVSLDNVIKKMATDKPMLDKYIRYYTVLANGETKVQECDETCRANTICSLDNLDKTSLNGCVEALVGVSTRGCSSSFIVILAGFIMCFFLHQM